MKPPNASLLALRNLVPVATTAIAEDQAAIVALEAENARLREALTPSAGTKAAYIGEFQFTVSATQIDESGEPYEYQNTVTVPWTAIKEIMAAISARSALNPEREEK